MSAKSKRILALLNDPKYRQRILDNINSTHQDEDAHVHQNQDQEIKVLKEMNELEEFRERVDNGGE